MANIKIEIKELTIEASGDLAPFIAKLFVDALLGGGGNLTVTQAEPEADNTEPTQEQQPQADDDNGELPDPAPAADQPEEPAAQDDDDDNLWDEGEAQDDEQDDVDPELEAELDAQERAAAAEEAKRQRVALAQFEKNGTLPHIPSGTRCPFCRQLPNAHPESCIYSGYVEQTKAAYVARAKDFRWDWRMQNAHAKQFDFDYVAALADLNTPALPMGGPAHGKRPAGTPTYSNVPPTPPSYYRSVTDNKRRSVPPANRIQ